MTAVGTPDGTRPPRRVPTLLVTVVSCAVLVVALVTLAGQAVRGNRVVGVQLAPTTVHQASVDDAFYRCIEIQAKSLVGPGQTVALSTDNLADVVTMIKGFGSWITVADPASRADVVLTLDDGRNGPGNCLGTRVVATYRGPDGHTTVRLGTGSELAGQGPPPAPPL